MVRKMIKDITDYINNENYRYEDVEFCLQHILREYERKAEQRLKNMRIQDISSSNDVLVS